MHARIVALLLIVATLWSLISIQDLDPALVPAAQVVAMDGSAQSEEPRPYKLHDRVWSAQAEIAADLPDVLPDGHGSVLTVEPARRLLRERWLLALAPYLDGPRRPPRGGLLS